MSLSRRRLIRNFGFLAGGSTLGLSLSRIAIGAQKTVVGKAPLRLICFSFPNGCRSELWNFNDALSPLSDMKDDVHVFRGLRNDVAESFARDGHEQGGASLFTGGVSLNGATNTKPSLDSVVGQYANSTVLKSPFVAGVCLGNAGGIPRTLSWQRRSWDANGNPNSFQKNPSEVLQYLFNDTSDFPATQAEKMRLLDFSRAEYSRILKSEGLLSKSAAQSLEQQLSRLTDLTQKLIASSETREQRGVCAVKDRNSIEAKFKSDFSVDYASYESIFASHVQLLVSALQCDYVRTGSLMFGNSGDDYFHSDWKFGDHDTSHYFSEETELFYRKYRVLHIATVRKLVDELKSVVDLDGSTLLDNTVVLVGSEFGDGRAHVLSPQPHLIVGGQNVLAKGREWDLDLSATPTQLYESLSRIFRVAYNQSVEGLSESAFQGLAGS